MNTFSEAERYTLNLLAAVNNGKPAPVLPAGLWPEVQAELAQQAVIGYPADLVESLNLSADEHNVYLAWVGRNFSNWYRLMSCQNEVLAAFKAANIPVAVLKGTAAAAQYANPVSRSMGDIDLIVPPGHFPQAFALMERMGWENDGTELEIYPRHAGFEKSGCPEVELHQFFSSCANKEQAHALDQEVFDGIYKVQWTDVVGFSVPILPTQANGLVLLAHINQHLSSGLGLRQVLDWLNFVKQHLSDELWYGGFKQATQNIGMEKLAVTITDLCRRYLGLSTPITWCDGADEQLVDDLLAYVMAEGNMGGKVEHGARNTRTVLHSFRNPAAIVRYLYAGGRSHWAPARKHVWLAPAACVYQVGHIIRKGLGRKVKLGTLVGDARKAQTETNLLERLEVTRY